MGTSEGSAEGPDGDVIDFDRFLYQLANVDHTQPCPFLFRLSTQTVNQGASLTVYEQGLKTRLAENSLPGPTSRMS